MTYGVTPEGFKAKRFDDIVNDLGEQLLSQLGIDIDSSPDSYARVLTNIVSLALAEEWSLPASLQSMFDIDKAEGKHLDDLVGYVGIRRLSAAPSVGNQYITASSALTIPNGTVFKDSSDNNYVTPNAIIVDTTNMVSTNFMFTGLTTGIITVEVNGVESSATVANPLSATTIESAIVTLVNDINNKTASNLCQASYLGFDGVGFSILSSSDLVSANVTYSTNLTPTEIISFGTINTEEDGAIGVLPDTVTTPPSIAGIVSTTNRYEFTLGRLEETDIDLRNRHSLSLKTAGGSTVEAIRADLLNVVGVTTATVIENDTMFTDINNIPPKSFLSIIEGGTDQDIGDTLWYDAKPAGIETYGNVPVLVIDSQGNPQQVKFSRPQPVYIHMRVDYTIYSEESVLFPSDGEDQMLNQILLFGDTLGVGTDVIPQRFSSQIFQNVGGLQRVDIYVGATVSPNDPTPTLFNVTLPVDQLSKADFDASRISFVEV